jgi:casein kinase II subunit beta
MRSRLKEAGVEVKYVEDSEVEDDDEEDSEVEDQASEVKEEKLLGDAASVRMDLGN